MTAGYPELQTMCAAAAEDVLLDGEIVILDERGRPDFAGLWARARGSSNRHACFMAFDLLGIGGTLLVDRPYATRRRMLEDLGLSGAFCSIPPVHLGEGQALFAATKEMGLEGVVVKRVDSRYRPGRRSRSWTKTKHFQHKTFALLGWMPPEERGEERGCVVLGLRLEAGIAMAGTADSGYGRDLVERLPRLTRAQVRELRRPGRMWEDDAPLRGDVKSLEWTAAGGLRHATIVSVAPP